MLNMISILIQQLNCLLAKADDQFGPVLLSRFYLHKKYRCIQNLSN